MSDNHIYSYGVLSDYLTGEFLNDTDDERIRQEMARILVEERDFQKRELIPRETIITTFAERTVTSHLDLIATINGQPLMVLRSAPGSLVSRERSAIAAARIYHPEYQLPLAVVYNGQDAELIDSYTGTILANGLQSFLPHHELEQWTKRELKPPLSQAAMEREKRILNAFDVELCVLRRD